MRGHSGGLLYAYDLDGTLLDTRAAVEEAYKRAGVKMPKDAFGKPWQAWLKGKNAAERHRQKNMHYARIVETGNLVKRLPMFHHMRLTHGIILTGASEAAVRNLDYRFMLCKHSRRIHCGLTVEQKGDLLASVYATLGRKGFYFDDDAAACRAIAERSGWICVPIRS